MINFFKGHPTLSIIPSRPIAEAYHKVIVENEYSDLENDPDNRHPLQYGTDSGNLLTREHIAKWCNEKYGRSGARPDLINLTAGSSYGTENILVACTNPEITKQVFLVSPTYFLINYAFIDAGFAGKITSVVETPGAEYDIDLAAFESKLVALDKQHGLSPVTDSESNVITDPTGRGARKFYRYLLYLVPSYSNPGGLTYLLETRLKLLQIARKHDVLLLSDDVYDLLHFGTQEKPIPKLCHLDQASLPANWEFGNSVSNSSFSKIAAPGLRSGWQETPTPKLATQLSTTGANKSGGTPSQLNISVVDELIVSGKLDEIISQFSVIYSSRSRVLRNAIRKYLPKATRAYGGDGGYFVWCTIDEPGIDLSLTLERLNKEDGVLLPSGSNFEVEGDSKGWGRTSTRMCIAFLTEDQIEEGIRKWGAIMQREYPHLY